MSIKRDAAFDGFVSQAQGILGNDLSEDWLFEIWSGADADPNRALNHVLDSPEDKIRRGNGSGGNKSSSESKPAKKSHKSRESRPAPAAPVATWGDDDYSVAPAPQQHQAPPQQQPPQYAPPPQQQPQYAPPPQQPQYAPQQAPQFGQPPQYGQPAMPQYGQPAMPQYGQPTMPQYGQPAMPQYGQAAAMPQFGQSAPQITFDPMTGMPVAGMNPIQQAQTMFVQQQQQQRLMGLKACIDSVLSNPATLTSPQIMQNLQDTMIQALEAPNATLQLAERARQSAQTAQFIQIMQSQVAQMLCDPKVATNPALLQQLNAQMNQLRMLTMQHVAQQQIDANPASALSMSMPMLTQPSVSATMLSRAAMSGNGGINSGVCMPANNGGLCMPSGCFDEPSDIVRDEEWWAPTPKSGAALSERNPFRDDETVDGGSRRSLKSARSPRSTRSHSPAPNMMSSMPNMMSSMQMPNMMPNMMGSMPNMMGSMPNMMGMPMGSMPNMMGSMPNMMGSMPNMPFGQTMGNQMASMYGSQQPGYYAPNMSYGRQF